MKRGLAFGVMLVAAIALVAGFTSTRAEGPATVYAAASLTEVFPKVSPSSRFQFLGSNQLALQITRGAPADVFASASPIYTQDLYRNGLVEKPRTFATNSLVLAVPRSNPAKIRSVSDLAKRPKLKLVVAGAEGADRPLHARGAEAACPPARAAQGGQPGAGREGDRRQARARRSRCRLRLRDRRPRRVVTVDRDPVCRSGRSRPSGTRSPS